MIEITAKQLYDIYKELPDPELAFKQGNHPRCHAIIVKKPRQDYRNTISRRCGYNIAAVVESITIEFEIDFNASPSEWKPTTDLIIKA